MHLSLDDIAALRLVLEHIPIKTVLTSAMHYLAEQQETRAQDSASICYQAINTFLK